MRLEIAAQAFATKHHAAIGQVRKYTGEPYITHPAAVVELVRSVPHTEVMLAAAWLHDTVEDTTATLTDIYEAFGKDVAQMVEMLTDISIPGLGNRAQRKAMDHEHTALASPEAKTVKLADLIDNTRSIVARDPKFARIYLQEKQLLLQVLREGDSTLWQVAFQLADPMGAPHAG